ncbi:hypothetical protein FM103_20015 [Corynebacterium xerosis]|nr:hypothetical protein FM103_20015 [Corynebacterium xerosis]
MRKGRSLRRSVLDGGCSPARRSRGQSVRRGDVRRKDDGRHRGDVRRDGSAPGGRCR